MMAYTVVLTEQAKDNIAYIYGYILNVLKSEINAEPVHGWCIVLCVVSFG